ncbi:MAG TPA: hypothetical protein VMM36_02265 [Opitutaceae bacterium]|nr:hypothetical protein [Opitutaceae bacterium]
MPNTTKSSTGEAGWIAALHRLESIRELLSTPEHDLPMARREPLEAEFFDLQGKLPTEVFVAVRSRLAGDQPLIASAYGMRCGFCNLSMPRGDHTTLLTGDEIVRCQICGVVLYAGADERQRVASARAARESKRAGWRQ